MSLAFDATFYQQQRPDVYNAFIATAGSTGLSWAEFAANHYSTFGRFEGSDPNAQFDTTYYLETYPDVAAAGVNPFDHFQQFGASEGRFPTQEVSTAGFVEATYLAANADVQAAVTAGTFTSGYQHWILFGQFEGRSGAPILEGGSSGSTFSLTTAVDVITGTSGDDTIVGSDTTYTTGDTIDGGGGTDKFNIIMSGANTALVDTTNVENFFVRDTNGNTVNASGWSSPAQVWNDRSTAAVDVDNIGALATIGLNQVTAIGSTTTMQFTPALLTGSSDTVNVVLQGSSNAGAVRADDGTAGGGVETFSLTATDSNKIAALTAGTDTKTVNIAGTGDLEITATIANATTVDGSSSTGALKLDSAVADVTLKSGSGNDTLVASHASGVSALSNKVVIDSGAGDDTVQLTNIDAFNEIQDGATISGGDGTDILAVDDGFAAALNGQTTAAVTSKGITGFETLRVLTATTAADNINVARLSTGNTITTVDFAAAATNATTVSGLASGGTVELSVAGNGLVVDITDAAKAGSNSDVANLVLNGAHAGGNIDYGTATIANVETINVNSTSSATTVVAADANEIDLTVANAQTINVTGNVKADLNGAALTGASLQTIDGSANTAGLDVTVAGATQGITINGSAGADNIVGGNGADAITGNAGNDTLNGGAGTALDVLTGGDGNDTFVALAGETGITASAFDEVTDYSNTTTVGTTDTIDFTGVAVGTTALGAGWSLDAGMATKTGASVADFIAAVQAAGTANETYGFVNGSDTYVYNAGANGTTNTTDDALVKLTGFTGVAVVTADTTTANEILIA